MKVVQELIVQVSHDFSKTLALIIGLLVFAQFAVGETGHMTEILVKGAPHAMTQGVCEFQPAQDQIIPYTDSGDLLRSIPGVTGGRMGGHGVEPVVRGQSQNQINVTSDGAFVYGGCPNRMDPPSSILNAEDPAKLITVTRGYKSVLQGPGASGGSISMQSLAPSYQADRPVRAFASSGYGSNGDRKDINGYLGYVAPDVYVRGGGFWKEAGNYEDGMGNDVRSAFENFGGRTELGWAPMSNTDVKFSWDKSRTEDALFAGAGMDSPKTDSDIFSMNASHSYGEKDFVNKVSLNAYTSFVDHIMDNYSLRTRTDSFMRAPSESNTNGGRLMFNLLPSEHPLTLGFDVLSNNRDARRYSNKMDRNNVNMLQSILWPDLTTRNLGVFAESPFNFTDKTALTVGVRYDNVDIDAGAADLRAAVPPMSSMAMPTSTMMSAGRTPNELYQRYYGRSADFDQENNLGGTARLEHKLTENTTLFTGFARAIRSADATERALAGDGMETWVGNPGIDPEAHHIIDIGTSVSYERSNFTLLTYYDSVNDYILRDRARGQKGILQNDGATIYRNIDASLAGIEAQYITRVSENLELSCDLSYTRGQDEDREKPLAQIPPLFGSVGFAYKNEGWRLGATTRFAAKQTRVDTDKVEGTGRDVRETPQYGVIDIYAALLTLKPLEVRVGISNLFDSLYANHLNRSSAFDPDEVQVNEPGRSYFVQLRAAF